jgi:hypothetical protein
MVRSQHLAQLILAGRLEITTELRNAVAKRSGPILIGTVELDFNAEPAEILQRALPVTEELKRKEESEIVRDLTVQPAEGSWAVTGLGTTLDLLNKGRIWQLVYAEGFHGRALECRQCAAIFSESHEHCVYCGSPLEALGDLADLIHKHSIARGARVRKISTDAGAALSAEGGIGGFVRAPNARAGQGRQVRSSRYRMGNR